LTWFYKFCVYSETCLQPMWSSLLIIIWGRCNLKHSRRKVIFLPVYKISSLKITLPKTLQLKTLDFLQQTITMSENAQWQMIKDSVLFALSSEFSVSLFHFYLKKKSTRSTLFCISSFFSLHRSLYLLLTYCLYN
jgi:hypothetical protein